MRIELELYGLVLRVTFGPEDAVEEPVFEYGDRLHVVDATHAGPQEDPVFPNLDWGDDEERGPLGVGPRRQRGPDRGVGDGRTFGFDSTPHRP